MTALWHRLSQTTRMFFAFGSFMVLVTLISVLFQASFFTSARLKHLAEFEIPSELEKLALNIRLQDRHFAFHGCRIREVIDGHSEVFYIPGMHESVEGVMNLRGDIQSVLNLNDLLHLPRSDGPAAGRAILLGQGADMLSGIRIDELLDVTDVAQSQLKPPLDSLPAHLKPLVSGLLEYRGLPVVLLDLDLVLHAWQQQLS